MKLSLAILLLLCGFSRPGRAQGEFRTWCFGYSITPSTVAYRGIRIDFGATGPVTPPQLWPGGYGAWLTSGTATLCDARGALLFSTDGIGVIDNTPASMPNGDLNGVQGTDLWFFQANIQPVAVAPAPGNPHAQYVFYWNRAAAAGQPAFALSWARVDMRLNGGRGAVVEKGAALTTVYNPRVTVVRHQNNRDFWVITRDLVGRGFQAFLLSRAGVSPTPVVSLAGQAQFSDDGELKAAPNGQRLACGAAIAGPASETLVCVYDFDNATGQVRNEQVVHRRAVPPLLINTGNRPDTGYAYATSSCSFSPNSRLLYTAEADPNQRTEPRRVNDIWQYDLGQPTLAAVAASRFLVSNLPLPAEQFDAIRIDGLQLAPDGTLWAGEFYYRMLIHPITGQLRSLAAAIIRRPDVAGAGCGFEPEAYPYLPGQTPGRTLPNVITNMLYAPAALNYEVGCPEDSVQYWASSAGDPAGLRWDFGEPASGAANAATGPQVAHHYAQGGTYAVRLTQADGRVLTQAVTVAAQATDFTHANIFTPNGDGRNDQFTPLRTPLPGGQLRVFSRWGQSVFRTATADALRWDGAGQPAGDYFYQLDYPDCRGTTRHQRGTVTLVR